jgi:hypothetical protein
MLGHFIIFFFLIMLKQAENEQLRFVRLSFDDMEERVDQMLQSLEQLSALNRRMDETLEENERWMREHGYRQ